MRVPDAAAARGASPVPLGRGREGRVLPQRWWQTHPPCARQGPRQTGPAPDAPAEPAAAAHAARVTDIQQTAGGPTAGPAERTGTRPVTYGTQAAGRPARVTARSLAPSACCSPAAPRLPRPAAAQARSVPGAQGAGCSRVQQGAPVTPRRGWRSLPEPHSHTAAAAVLHHRRARARSVPGMDVPGTDTDTMGTPPASPGAADSSGVLQESDSSSLHAQQVHGTAGKRVSRACARCSSSKRRCDGRRPACAVCMAIGVECQYSAASIRRGPPKGFRSGGAESVKAKLLRTLETTLRDLVGKLGEEQTESEIARLASDRGLRLTSAREQNAARGSPRTPMPSSLVSLPASLPSMMPVPEHAHGPGPAPLPFLHARADAFLGRDLSSSREQLPPHLNRKHPASSERETHSAKRARPNHAGTTRRLAWDDSPGAAWTSLEADPSRHRVEGEGGDILGINEHGDTMHRGSSSGLQLLSKRTLPPLPGTALPLPFGTPGGGRDVMRRAGSKESDSSRARGAQSSSPLVPKEGVRVPFPDPRRSGSGTCPSGFALSGARRSSSVHSNPGSPSIPSLMRPRNFNLGEMMPSNSSLSFDNGRTSPRARMRAGSATSPQAGPGSGPVHDYAPDSTHLPPTSPRSSDLTLRPLRKSRPSSGGIQTIEAPIDFVDPANDPVVTPEECRMLFGRYWHHVHSEWPVLFKVCLFPFILVKALSNTFLARSARHPKPCTRSDS